MPEGPMAVWLLRGVWRCTGVASRVRRPPQCEPYLVRPDLKSAFEIPILSINRIQIKMSTVIQKPETYVSKHKIRIVTAASLFDGHDAAINIMRRIIQSSGAEVIHLGHDRSVQEIVDCAIQEDANAIALTSYQGGHMEFFKYMYDLLKEKDCSHIRIFGGGGGTILPSEIEELHKYGIARIYSPDDGRSMG